MMNSLGTRVRRAPRALSVVAFAGERSGQLDRLDPAFEHLGEGTLDEAAQATLEALQYPHHRPPSKGVEIVTAEGGRRRVNFLTVSRAFGLFAQVRGLQRPLAAW